MDYIIDTVENTVTLTEVDSLSSDGSVLRVFRDNAAPNSRPFLVGVFPLVNLVSVVEAS